MANIADAFLERERLTLSPYAFFTAKACSYGRL